MPTSRPPQGASPAAVLPALLRATHLFGLALGSAFGRLRESGATAARLALSSCRRMTNGIAAPVRRGLLPVPFFPVPAPTVLLPGSGYPSSVRMWAFGPSARGPYISAPLPDVKASDPDKIRSRSDAFNLYDARGRSGAYIHDLAAGSRDAGCQKACQ